MNIETHITDQLAAYALNILDADEAAEAAAHLESCPVCQQELQTYQELVGLMATAVPSVAPPLTLKQRLMHDIRQEKQVETVVPLQSPKPIVPPTSAPAKTRWWVTLRDWFQQRPILQPVLLLLVALLLVSNFQLRQRLAEADHPAGFGTVTLTSIAANDPGTGILIISADGMHGTLVVQELPVLPETQTYQLWLIKDGHPTSGGMFNVGEDGYHAIWVGSDDPLASYEDFALTIEPAEGSAYPTGSPVLNN
ncbi:MAG: anti-sigma factor [Anaerolineaceae bacterium]|nr:anti-sigma factor [Anaerolineaceae bacterium]